MLLIAALLAAGESLKMGRTVGRTVGRTADNQHGMENHYQVFRCLTKSCDVFLQNHFMDCSKCGNQLKNKNADGTILREKMEDHKVSVQCGANVICTHPNCDR